MYGVIGSAVVLGVIITQFIKKSNMKNVKGEQIKIAPKQFSIWRYLLGGIIFGFGWALTGACPGPMFILAGNGVFVIFVAIASGLLGTYAYGKIRHKLPH